MYWIDPVVELPMGLVDADEIVKRYNEEVAKKVKLIDRERKIQEYEEILHKQLRDIFSGYHPLVNIWNIREWAERAIDNETKPEIILDIDTSTESEGASPDNINKALEGFDKNVNRLKTEYVSQEELSAMKAQLKTIIINGLESNSSRETMLNTCKNSPYGMAHYTKLLDAIDKVTVEDIMATANYVFANPPITSIVASEKTLKEIGL